MKTTIDENLVSKVWKQVKIKENAQNEWMVVQYTARADWMSHIDSNEYMLGVWCCMSRMWHSHKDKIWCLLYNTKETWTVWYKTSAKHCDAVTIIDNMWYEKIDFYTKVLAHAWGFLVGLFYKQTEC